MNIQQDEQAAALYDFFVYTQIFGNEEGKAEQTAAHEEGKRNRNFPNRERRLDFHPARAEQAGNSPQTLHHAL
jgi:hypothetical protein